MIYYTIFFSLFIISGIVPYRRVGQRWPANMYLAFIVALYAEMLGFPLTLYILTWLLGTQTVSTYEPTAWFLWTPPIGWWIGWIHLLSLSMIFIGLFLLFFGWRKIFRAHIGGERLLTDGIYGYVRHPQYLGILIFAFGMLIQYPTLLTLTMYAVLVVLYYRLAKREEFEMERALGDVFHEYRRKVPMLIPRLTGIPSIRGMAPMRFGLGDKLVVLGFTFVFSVWLVNAILNYTGYGYLIWPLWNTRLFTLVIDFYFWEVVVFSSIALILSTLIIEGFQRSKGKGTKS